MPSISLPDLVAAYRKAKVDLFYSSDPRRLELIEYEIDLDEKLAALLERLQGADEAWVSEESFLGDFTFAPKRLEEPPESQQTFWSDPVRSWDQRTNGTNRSALGEFRLMSRCSIDFHVVSTLWMLQVGTYLDRELSESAFGNRLRRAPDGGPNRLGSGSFLPYQPAYQRWRDDGLTAMARALGEGKEVIALTADVTAFYHRLDAGFLERVGFTAGVLDVELDSAQAKLNRLFVAALRGWSRMVATATGWRSRGLPVGLPASAVVANLALAELDVVIERFAPLYYGRYVDDVLLVVETNGGLTDQRGLWDWLVERSDGLLTREPASPLEVGVASESAIRFVPWYLAESTVAFENSKNKTFHLSGPSGLTMIESIRVTIRERSSEWRALATMPDDVGDIGHSIASVLRGDGDAAITLRDADRVSARKQSFSLRLRDLGVYERNLPADEWAEQRNEFFRATCDHVLTLPAFFELAPYLPRLVALAAAAEDRDSIVMLVRAVARLVEDVRGTCTVRVAAFSPAASERDDWTAEEPAWALVLDRWVSHLIDQIVDEIASGWRSRMRAGDLRQILAPLKELDAASSRPLPGVMVIHARHRSMARRDLAYHPYRWTLLGMPGAEQLAPTETPDVPLDPVVAAGANLLVMALRVRRVAPRRGLELRGEANAGIVFATRPPTMMELQTALPSRARHRYGVAPSRVVSRILTALRGQFSTATAQVRQREGWPTLIEVPVGRGPGPVRIALAMLGVDENNALASATGTPNLSRQRFNNFRVLLDEVAAHNGRPDYLILPELAMPAQWFPVFARGLRRSGISLVSGIEHQPTGRGKVANQVWAALKVDGWGLRYSLHRQDKQRPARPEKKLLAPLKLTVVPQQPWRLPPVIEHGDFRFSLLICSEMTNIDYRAHLRGAIDALIVPEWNTDVHWFEALVESASLDLHAYIAQANTLGYGDTRVRAPMKHSFARDVVRLKGGTHDYFVMGDLDTDWLRRFQTAESYSVPPPSPPRPDAELKPLPDGFAIDPERESW